MPFQVEVRVNHADYGNVIREGVVAMAKTIREKSRQDVAAGGHFGSGSLKGVTTTVHKVEGGFKVGVILKPAYMKVFEFGATSAGHPLLWIPVAPDAKHIRAKAFPGGLIRPGGKNGKRILISKKDKQIKYVGVARTHNSQRFHLRSIAFEEATRFIGHMGTVVI